MEAHETVVTEVEYVEIQAIRDMLLVTLEKIGGRRGMERTEAGTLCIILQTLLERWGSTVGWVIRKGESVASPSIGGG